MYRAGASRLRPFNGRDSSRYLARYACSTTVASQTSSSGLFSRIFGGKARSLPPLDFPLEGVTVLPPLPDYVEPAKTKITTLSNGLKIASEASPNPAASIGLYLRSGTMYETPNSFGVTHLLERMAFKSTTNRSRLRVVREVEAIGGNVTTSASREHMGYNFDALKTHVPEMVEILVDCVRNPALLDWEVNETLQKLKFEIEVASNNHPVMVLDDIHTAGYAGGLANPLIAQQDALDSLNSSVLEEFVAANYTARRMVLCASGVEHEELLSIAEPLVSDLPNARSPEEPKSVYIGGDHRVQCGSGVTHFALAFELPGGWLKEKDYMVLTVLQMLMGGGGSFSAGGPGKGMYSRLYLNVLNQYPQMQYCSAFSAIYSDTGLFGIQAMTSSDFASKAMEIAAKELVAVASPGQVNQLQLDRAKAATKTAVLMNLESGMVAYDNIGRQILTYGERKLVEHFLKTIDEVTLKEITSIAEKLLSSRLTMASRGDVIHVPTYHTVSNWFRSN